LQGNRFTWSNKQASPLLERLDWFFDSIPWITTYPGLTVSTLSRDISDHHPCLISVNTNISQSKVFKIENYWLLHDECQSGFTILPPAPLLEQPVVVHLLERTYVSRMLAIEKHGGNENLCGSGRRSVTRYVYR
jgi:hypothetical protein